jgi:putative endonuclease
MLNKLLGHLRAHILPGSRTPSSPASALGARGEKAAAKYLRKKGYAILERNFRMTQGEIDLVAFRDGVLAFVEVRAQTAPALIDPLFTITRRKQRRIIKAAEQYVALHRPADEGIELRFDVVTVLFAEDERKPSISHLEGAFATPAGSY